MELAQHYSTSEKKEKASKYAKRVKQDLDFNFGGVNLILSLETLRSCLLLCQVLLANTAVTSDGV